MSMQIQMNQAKTSAKRFFSNERKQTGSSQSTEMESVNPLESLQVIVHHHQQKYNFKIDAMYLTVMKLVGKQQIG
jgi:hypothetical protein